MVLGETKTQEPIPIPLCIPLTESPFQNHHPHSLFPMTVVNSPSSFLSLSPSLSLSPPFPIPFEYNTQGEIFGPILPIFTVDSLDEAIAFVNDHEKPLAFYIFTESKKTFEKVNKLTSAGGVCQNDAIMHAGGKWMPLYTCNTCMYT